jgi:DNA polymerase-3 subunit gamma/tau
MADRDAGRVLLEVAEAISAGRDPRRLGTDLLEQLRDGFLATQARSLVLLADDAVAAVEAQARRLGTPALVRAMEVLGQALIDMRDAPDPRITLEVALVRLSAVDADDSRSSLLVRIERLERLVGDRGEGGAGPPPAVRSIPPPASSVSGPPVVTPPPTIASGQSALGAHRRPREPRPSAGPDPLAPPTPTSGAPPARMTDSPAPTMASASLPSREELTVAWGDSVLAGLRPGVKVYLSSGRFVGVDDSGAIYAVPDRGLLVRAETNRAEMEAALAAHFGRPVPVRLVLDDPAAGAVMGTIRAAGAGTAALRPSPGEDPEDPTAIDLDDLIDAPAAVLSPEQRLLEAFPGAEEVQP